MARTDESWFSSIALVFTQFIQHYRGSLFQFIGITVSSLIIGMSGIFAQSRTRDPLIFFALVLFLGSLLVSYRNGSPFGYELSCTPTHIVDGVREPDKMSESEGIILVQGETATIHGEVRLTKFIPDFRFQIKTSSEIRAELQAKPRTEHSYNPVNNILSCENVSERWFPYKIDIYPSDDVGVKGRYHTFEIIDLESEKSLIEYQVIDVS